MEWGRGRFLIVLPGMRLIEMRLRGYGRLRDINLYTDGKLTSIVGPNEAGKTTLIEALLELNSKGWSKPYMLADPNKNIDVITARFALEGSELDAVSDYEVKPGYLILTKDTEGTREFALDQSPVQKRDWRERLARELEVALHFTHAGSSSPPIEDSEQTQNFRAALLDGKFDEPQKLAKEWVGLSQKLEIAERVELAEREIQQYVEMLSNAQSLAQELLEELEETVPTFTLYSSDSRNIPARVAINEAAVYALRPLLQVGGMTIDGLRSLFRQDINTLNNQLRRVGRAITSQLLSRWGQGNLELQLHAEAAGVLVSTILDLDADNGQPIDRRSEGLRQFLALSAALHPLRRSDSAILLVDEVEQHLHLQAQGELIKFLDGQGLARQVIYSTHSPGALPEDLNNVRAVEPLPDGSSVVHNRPWQQGSRQVQNLFRLLGAGSFVFAALRGAVVTEGTTDAMLYPVLFREALERGDRPLGWQFLPGYSQHRNPEGYNEQGVHVAFLLDGDEAGRAMAEELTDPTDPHRIPTDKVVCLERDRVLEDYVEPGMLVEAVRRLSEGHNPPVNLSASDLPEFGRMALINTWAKENAPHFEVDKKRLSSELLELNRQGQSLLDPSRKHALRDIAHNLERALRIEVGGTILGRT